MKTAVTNPSPSDQSRARDPRARWAILVGVILVPLVLTVALALTNAGTADRASMLEFMIQSVLKPDRLGPKPRIEFGDTPSGPVAIAVAGDNLVASVLAVETLVDEPTSIKVPIRNTGQARLEMVLYFLSCDCVNGVKFNDGWMPPKHHLPATLEPGETGELEITWKATPEQVADAVLPKEGRFSVEFKVNDPRAPKLRVEINSRIRWSESKRESGQAK